ncbi:MAG: hypothetical protein QOH57_1035 [Mycobacterium sp.]|jgi:hypothetical protein|nr:hypothetical protein [Mycobacterium sp.]
MTVLTITKIRVAQHELPPVHVPDREESPHDDGHDVAVGFGVRLDGLPKTFDVAGRSNKPGRRSPCSGDYEGRTDAP